MKLKSFPYGATAFMVERCDRKWFRLTVGVNWRRIGPTPTLGPTTA